MKKILLLGACGNFGKRIALALTKKNIPLVLGGRNATRLEQLTDELNTISSTASVLSALVDIHENLVPTLTRVNPHAVINTCGPFQRQDYSVAKACIANKIHYIDLADGRDFVSGIKSLDHLAREQNVAVISGASTVPALSSAVIDKFSEHFLTLDTLIYGISPGQKTARGLATTRAVLSYVGQPIKDATGSPSHRYGWQNIYRQKYPLIGHRWMANCDIPDLDLFPDRYPLQTIKFSAGLENPVLHFGLWLFSWLVRLGLPLNLPKHAELFLAVGAFFDRFGTDEGGMHLLLSGKDNQEKEKMLQWYIIGKNGDGPQIPAIPAIILAQKLISDELNFQGAAPCMGFITLDEYLHELEDFSTEVRWSMT
jgi:Saccharopine dehydrogenase NADP binding domain